MRSDDDRWEGVRRRMVETQIRGRGIRDPRVLDAMTAVPRHLFLPDGHDGLAYGDHPVDIGHGQTMSQPYIVAYMTEALGTRPDDRVLEIGTGCGYQTAVLATLVAEVFTIEIVEAHATAAAERLAALGYHNVHVRCGDGYAGWPDAAPFDGIIVTAAPDHVPPALSAQLKPGGRLVIPVGRGDQQLLVLTQTADGLREDERLAVRFVPLTRRQD